jgi:methanogenic corrinoid protein MtbC1
VSTDDQADQLASAERGRYNIQAVARRTGVPAPTIRAWERRYGVPHPARSSGRQRLYSDQDVRLITWMRERTGEGMTAARAAALWRETGGAPVSPPALNGPQPPEGLAREFVSAALRHDAAAAEAVLSRAFALYDAEAVCAEVIRPALVEIGEGWHRGEVEVATEHLATQVARGALTNLLRLIGYQRGETLVVEAAAPGERHDLGALMLAISLARRGLGVLYLGADVPADSLARVARQLRPGAVAISAAAPETVESLAQVARQLGALPHPPRVIFGGQAFDQEPGLADDVPGVLLGPDLPAASARVRALLRNGHSAA